MNISLQAYVWARCLAVRLGSAAGTARDEAGEGVISTAIAVLIMAALGAVMWVGFQAIWGNASSQTTNQINQIGAP
jgi:type VI protein secretion system component VasF